MGVSIALLIMLAISLYTAAALATYSAARGLLADLKDGVAGVRQSAGFGMRRGRGQGGMHTIASQSLEEYSSVWAAAGRLRTESEAYGYGRVPWIGNAAVVWAALRQPDGSVQVAWTRLAAVRAASGGAFALVAAAVVLSFAVSALVTDMGVRRVAAAVNAAAQASRRMARGNFAEQMEVRDTQELSDLSDAVNHLALSLDKTFTQLKAQNIELSRLEKAQRQFVADASHELRAPLTSMAITLDAATDGLMSDDEKAEAWFILHTEVKRLSRIVTGLLDLERIESGRETLNISDVDIAQVVGTVHRWYSSLPGPLPAMQVSVDDSQGLLTGRADVDALHRCLVNFVSNAMKATPPEGTISIWARRASGDDASWVDIGVTDTGRGMTPEELCRVFDRFARSAEVRSSQSEGSGLGLSIVQALASAMGGQAMIESTPGHGTTAWVRLRSTSQLMCH